MLRVMNRGVSESNFNYFLKIKELNYIMNHAIILAKHAVVRILMNALVVKLQMIDQYKEMNVLVFLDLLKLVRYAKKIVIIAVLLAMGFL